MSQHVPDRQSFRECAEALRVQLGGSLFMALPKTFSTNSYGWYHSGKLTVDFSDTPLVCQVSLSIVVCGSKDAPSLPDMSAAERLEEQRSLNVGATDTFVSDLYPVKEFVAKPQNPGKASGSPQDASQGSNGGQAAETLPNASSGQPEAPKRKRKAAKGGA